MAHDPLHDLWVVARNGNAYHRWIMAQNAVRESLANLPDEENLALQYLEAGLLDRLPPRTEIRSVRSNRRRPCVACGKMTYDRAVLRSNPRRLLPMCAGGYPSHPQCS